MQQFYGLKSHAYSGINKLSLKDRGDNLLDISSTIILDDQNLFEIRMLIPKSF